MRDRSGFGSFIYLLIVALILAGCGTEQNQAAGEPGAEDYVDADSNAGVVADNDEAVDSNAADDQIVGEDMADEDAGGADNDTDLVDGSSGTETRTDRFIIADELIGESIVTGAGEVVGVVVDLLVDESGVAQYIIFRTADYVPGGERMLVVPWTQFNSGPPAVTSAEFELAPMTLIYSGQLETLEAAAEVDPAVVEQTDLFLDAAAAGMADEYNNLIRLRQISSGGPTGRELVNTAGEDLGGVESAVLNLEQGEVGYLIADVGGFLNLSEKQVAVPWERLVIAREDNAFVLDADQQILENAPTVDVSIFSEDRVVESTWDDDIENYWQGTS